MGLRSGQRLRRLKLKSSVIYLEASFADASFNFSVCIKELIKCISKIQYKFKIKKEHLLKKGGLKIFLIYAKIE